MNVQQKNDEAIFKVAIKIRSAADREAYLKEVCGSDAQLLERLHVLIEAHDNADGFLDTPPFVSRITEAAPVLEGPGTVIGRYKLLEKVGEGGMAVVYMAEQQKPLCRRVALKIIKLGMDTKQVIARFEAERQALAMMDHPNIAKVFDAGTTETGRPFFVMELVRGLSITDYCDKKLLSTRERLDLFLQVCAAIQHAHQKGIIHRDIKPSNVMVTLHEGKPLPLVIDFGIAKATSQRLTEKTVFTRYAQMIGTPEYMSPEQAEMNRLDVDTRTDIYSLGVLLYELLTGTLPFDGKKLLEAGYLEIQRIIREEEPEKPSTRLSTTGEPLTEIAKRRKTSPDSLAKLVRGDLDWIVMKSLEKNPSRRYGTTVELAADIKRHLSNEPVYAGPPSVMYRARKYVQRHGTLVAFVAVVLTILVVGLVVSLSLYVRMRGAFQTVTRLETQIDADQTLSRARSLFNQGRHLAALEELKKVLAKQDVGAPAYLLQAQVLIDMKRHEEAEAILKPLAQADPEVAATAHYLLARISLGMDPAKAKRHEALAAALLPETAEAYVLRAMAAPTAEEALEWFNHAIVLNPSYYPARKARALIYYSREEDDRAIEDAAVLIALRPEDSLGYLMRAVLRRRSDRLHEALADHNRAIDLSEDATELFEARAERYVTYAQMGDYRSALDDARYLAEMDRESDEHRLSILGCLLALGDFARVSQEYRSMLQTDPRMEYHWRSCLAWEVFELLQRGRKVTIPTEMAEKAPFPAVQAAIDCYNVLVQYAKPVPSGGGFLIHDWAADSRHLLCGNCQSYGALGQVIHSAVPSIALGTKLKTIDIESGAQRPVAMTNKGYGFATWSPDGRHIAFVDRDANLCIVPADGGESRVVLPKAGLQWYPQWSLDSQRLYNVHRESDGTWLCSVDINGHDPSPAKLIKCSGQFAVCETGTWMASANHMGISLCDLSLGSLVYRCASPWPVNSWELRLSPSGRELFFASRWSYTYTGPLVLDTQERQLYRVLDHPVDQILWSPDGTKLAIGVARQIWIMELDPNVPISRVLGRKIPENDWLGYWLEKHTRAVISDPSHPENYLERASAYMALGRYEQAQSDLDQFIELAKPEDHHIGRELFSWLRRYCFAERGKETELLTGCGERLMERFPGDVRHYQDLIELIADRHEKKGRADQAERWRARLEEAKNQAGWMGATSEEPVEVL